MRLTLNREQRIADRYLRTYDLAESRVESSLIAIERADSALTSITASIGAIGFSGANNDKILNALINLDKAVEDLRQASGSLTEQFLEVEEFITEIQRRDEMAGKVLRAVYINRLSVTEVSMRDETAYSKKTIYEYIRRGLDIAFEILSEADYK